MLSKGLLRRLTPAVIKEALEYRAKVMRVERLAERRRKLMSALAVIDNEMSKLEAAPMRRGPGRPPEAKIEKRGRWKRSAETRRKMAEAQRARWAKKPEAE